MEYTIPFPDGFIRELFAFPLIDGARYDEYPDKFIQVEGTEQNAITMTAAVDSFDTLEAARTSTRDTLDRQANKLALNVDQELWISGSSLPFSISLSEVTRDYVDGRLAEPNPAAYDVARKLSVSRQETIRQTLDWMRGKLAPVSDDISTLINDRYVFGQRINAATTVEELQIIREETENWSI